MTWILLFLSFMLPVQEKGTTNQNTVNAIIGDASYWATFGMLPTQQTNETLRLQTHLRFVHAYLEQVNTEGLSDGQMENRQRALDILADYTEAGIFPVNRAYPDQRRPCFIDAENRYCAVGYLMKETVGDKLPEAINEQYQYAYVMDLADVPALHQWAEEYGLTLEECAMIQPSYNFPPINPTPPPPPVNTTDPGVAISTGMLSGINTGLTVGNAIQMGQAHASNTLTLLGLVGGAGQFAFGLYRTAENDGAQTADVINMSVGMASATMAFLRLMQPRMPQKYGSLYWQPNQDAMGTTNGMGLGWVKSF